MRDTMFAPAVLAAELPPMQLNGLSTSGVGTGPGWADDGTLSPEEAKTIGEQLGQIGEAIGDVLRPKPKEPPKPPPPSFPWGPVLLGGAAIAGLFFFLRRK